MGIIRQIKKMFSKNIDVAENVKDKIFYLYAVKSRVVTIGANIIVPNSFLAVFVCKDKVTDVLPQGKFAISGVNLPKTFKRMGLTKANKKGKFPKNFASDIYFIKNTEIDNMQFQSNIALKKTCKKFGKVRAQSEGEFTLKVEDVERLLKYLLMDRAYITEGMFNTFIKQAVGNCVNDILQNSENDFYEILLNSSLVNNLVNNTFMFNKIWQDIGLKISNIKVNYLNVNSKLKEKIDNEINKLPNIKVNSECGAVEVEKAVNQQIAFDNFDVDESSNKESDNETLICRNCGHKINTEAVFCEKCGQRIIKF